MPDWAKATSHVSYGAYRCFVCADIINYGDTYKNLTNSIRAHSGCAEKSMKAFPAKGIA